MMRPDPSTARKVARLPRNANATFRQVSSATLRTRIPPRLADLHASDYAPLGHLPREDFYACFKFAVMRKLYASAVSEDRYRCAGAGMSVDEFLALRFDSDFSNHARYPVPQSRCAREGSVNLIVDHLVRFEALDAGLRKVCRTLCGVEQPSVHRTIRYLPNALRARLLRGGTALPHCNESAAGPREAADLTLAQRAIIEGRSAEDFRLFDYPLFRP
jgi:hypothetical protein